MVSYQASIHVPHIVGFWQPHTEYESVFSGRLSSITECMLWLANDWVSYDENATSYIDVCIDGDVKVSWQFSNGHVIRHCKAYGN